MVKHPGELRWETRLLAVVVLTLLVFGIATVYGAAGLQTKGAGLNIALSQISGAVIGGALLVAIARVDYRVWQRLAWPVLGFTIVLLIIPLLPFTYSIAPIINGARRWVQIGPLRLQPSELARLAVVIWCAMLAARKGDAVRGFKKGVLPFWLAWARSRGSSCWSRTCRWRRSWRSVARWCSSRRVPSLATSCCWDWRDAAGGAGRDHGALPHEAGARLHRSRQGGRRRAHQINESIIGVGAGRFLGVGFGEGQQKFHLPYAYSDFLFSTIAEEWGFIGVCLVVLLFSLFCWLGFRIARTAADTFGQYLAVGSPVRWDSPAFLHMAVSLGLMPDHRSHAALHVVRQDEPGHFARGAGILINIGRMRGRPAPKKSVRSEA
jgi:cell division protein FtsW